MFVQHSQMQGGELSDGKIYFLHQGAEALSKGTSRPSAPPLAGSSCSDDQEQGDCMQRASCNSSSPFVYLLISKLHWGWAGLGKSLRGFLYIPVCKSLITSAAAKRIPMNRCVWAESHSHKGSSHTATAARARPSEHQAYCLFTLAGASSRSIRYCCHTLHITAGKKILGI